MAVCDAVKLHCTGGMTRLACEARIDELKQGEVLLVERFGVPILPDKDTVSKSLQIFGNTPVSTTVEEMKLPPNCIYL